MGSERNLSCFEQCSNASSTPPQPHDRYCDYTCNSTVQCEYHCTDDVNITALSIQPHDLLVFLESTKTLQGLLFLVGNVISMTCLLVTIVVHVLVRKHLWNLQGQCLVSLTIALLLAKLAFQVNPYFTANKYVCSFMSILQHYFCLAAFLWLTTLIYNLWKFSSRSEITVRRRRELMRAYMVFSWGTPFTVVVTCILVEFLIRFGINYGSRRYCSVLGDELLLYSLAIPLGVVGLLNLVLFTMILAKRARKMESTSGSASMTLASRRHILCGITDLEVKGHSLFSYFKMSLLMLVAWITGFAASNSMQFCTHWFCDWWVFFVILNSLQGIFIFMNFCLNKDVFTLLEARSYMVMRRLKRSRTNIQRPRIQRRTRSYQEMADPDTCPTPQLSIRTVSGVVTETSSV